MEMLIATAGLAATAYLTYNALSVQANPPKDDNISNMAFVLVDDRHAAGFDPELFANVHDSYVAQRKDNNVWYVKATDWEYAVEVNDHGFEEIRRKLGKQLTVVN